MKILLFLLTFLYFAVKMNINLHFQRGPFLLLNKGNSSSLQSHVSLLVFVLLEHHKCNLTWSRYHWK